MTSSRLVRFVIAALLLIVAPTLASAATTEFRVLFDVDNDPSTGCTVNGMDGVDQVLVTQVTDSAGSAQVTRTHREVCTGSVLGGAVDIVTTGWNAGWNTTTKLLTLETRIPFSAFGSSGMPATVHAGFDANRNGSVHTAIANQNGTPIVIPQPPVRRRALSDERHIVLDGALADWGRVRPAVIGLASNGTPTLRLLRILAWPDSGDGHLYFAATAYLGSDYPYADDNTYLRQPGESLLVGAAEGVLQNDATPDPGVTLTAEKVSDPSRGSVVLNADGSFTYSPNHPQLLTDDEFEYKAVGGGKESNVARVVIEVDDGETPNPCDGQQAHPNAPCSDSYTTPEDTKKIVPAATGVLVNDPHSAQLVAMLATPPSHGTVVLNADGGFTYTPQNNFFGVDTFVYTAVKQPGAPQGIGGNATVTITVTPVNDPPILDGETFTIPENSPNNTIVGTVDAFDVDNNALSYSIVSGNTGGAFSINSSTGQIRVANSAALDYETTPSFFLSVRAEDADSQDSATITINLTDTNEPPIVVAGGTLVYTENDPATVINGSITVTDTDSAQLTGATAAITANFVNGQDVLSFTPVGAITGSFVGNTLTLTGNDTPANYQLALRSVTYQNMSDDPSVAPRTITWTATDGVFTSAPVTSTVQVVSVNDEPSFAILSDPPASNEDAGLQTVAGFASSISQGPDETGQTLTFTLTPTGTTGDLAFSSGPAIDASGTLTYTASANTNGTATFNVVLTDDGSNTAPNDNTSTTLSFTITVNAVNDPPTFNLGGNQTVNEDAGPQTVNGFASSISVGPANESAQTITAFNVTNDNNALFLTQPAIDTAGNLTYQSNANLSGSATVSVSATDSGGATSSPAQTFVITVNAINDEPSFAILADPPASNEDAGPQTVNGFASSISAGPADESGQTLTFTLTPTGTTGDLAFSSAPAIDASGTLTYTASTNTNGTATFNVVLTDDGSNTPPNDNTSTTLSFTITVTAVNDAPVLTAATTVGYTENSAPVTLAPALTITDVDSANMQSASVTITGNFHSGADVLACPACGTTVPGVSAVYGPGTGVLSLSGTDTRANYELALRSVTFASTSDNPSVAQRAIDWFVTDTDAAQSQDDTQNDTYVNITAVNDNPVVTAGAVLNYTENQAATAIDTGLVVTDVDSATLVGATVTISNNFASGEDVLAFANMGPITFVSYTGGVLTLSGTDSVTNYQAALRTVTYQNTSDNPSSAARTITWQVNDGAGVNNLSAPATSTVNVAPANDPPVVNAAAALAYTEGTGAVVIDNTVTVSDVDDTQISGATVQITANYVNGEDILAFTNAFGITGSFTAASGTLTLSGTASIANYQSALRTVTYQNTSTNPSVAPRTVTWTVNDMAPAAGTDTSVINITPVNSPPVLTAGGTLSYTENDPASVVDNTITVTDADTPNLVSATAQITANYQNGQDVLSYVTALGISGSFNAGNGTLTLTGTTTPANWQTALRNVLYTNTSDNPSTLARTVTWQIDDGEAISNLSNTPTSTINVAAVNDPPTINAAAALAYTEDDGVVVLDNTVLVADLDNANLASATVQITANYVNGEDVLAFTNAFGITGVFTAGTGTLILTGPATVANFQSALRTVTYQNTSQSPSAAPRTVTWTVNDGTANGTDTSTINISSVNDAPVLTVSGAISYTENNAAMNAATSANITDADDTNIESATIQITGNYVNGQDVLSYVTALGITGNFTAASGTLTLTGSTTLANYITALQNVQYVNTSDAPSALQRTLTWTVNDGDVNSNTQATTISVVAVNDGPVNTFPLATATNEDTDLTGLIFSIVDLDAGTDSLDVQITVTNGVVTLASTAGMTQIIAGDGTLDSFIHFRGPLSAWNAALNGVLFRPTTNFSGLATIQIVTSDQGFNGTGGTLTDTDTLNITVNPINDAPVLTVAAAPVPTYTENGAPITIATSANIADVDDVNIESATVQITGNYDMGGDVLAYTTALGITGVFTPASGTLTLTGSSSLANYATALQNVTFASTSENPLSAQRTVTWIVNDGSAASNSQATNINIINVNDPPVVNANDLAYTEDSGAVIIDAALTVTDIDDASLPSATVQITANYVNGEDILAFTNAFGITGSFAAGSGTLTLTGPASPANFQSALRTVTYQNTSNTPSIAPRTLTWTVNDDEPSSGVDTSTITVTATNDAPALTATGSLNYTENDPATNMLTSANITDLDDTNIESATIQITTNYQNGQDVLSYVTALGITGNFTAASGTLTLTGSATLANYITALQNVRYANTSENPSTLARSVTFSVNDGDANSNIQITTVNVTAVNDAPVVTPTGTPLTYTENDPATAVQPLITVTDVDSTNITSATIQITGNYQNGQDVLSYVTALGITGNFTAASGTLTLTGTTTVANYQTALRNVRYNNTSENPSQLARTVTWQVNDGAGVNNLSTPVNSTINVIAVNDAPSVTNEAFSVLGNTELRVDMAAGSTPNAVATTPGASSYEGVLDNETDIENDPVAITAITGCADASAPFDCTLPSGAVIHVDANGEFSFTPGPGDTSDSFTYTVTDTPVVGTAASANGTVTFNFTQMIWWVSQGGSGNGTSISPFGNFDNLDGAGGAGDVDDDNDFIYVHYTGTPLALSATVPLEVFQSVYGGGNTFTMPGMNGNGSTPLVAQTTPSQLTLATGDMFTIGNAMPVLITGMDLTATAGNVVALTTNGALSGQPNFNFIQNTVRGAGAEGIEADFNAGTTGSFHLYVQFNTWVTGTHTGNAIDVSRTAGTIGLTIRDNSGIRSSATAINVSGALRIEDFQANTISGDTGGAGAIINGATFDADGVAAGYQQVPGGNTAIGVSGNAVGTSGMTLTSVAGDLLFTDLDIYSGGGLGFSLTGTGAANIAAGTGTRVTVSSGVSIIQATGGPAVSVNNATADLQLLNLMSSSTTGGVSLTNVSDGSTSAARFSALTGSTITATGGSAAAFSVSGGNVGVSYAGTITNNGTGRAVSVDTLNMDDATDDLTFSGAIDENGAGILLNANSGSRLMTFSGGLDIDTTTGEGFSATTNSNALGLNITGTNDITSVSATALRITNTTIGSGNLAFRNVSSGNATAAADPASGIVLNNTGTLGGLTIAGTGSSGTGGTIQNTTSDAISLTSTQAPSFAWMNVTNTGGQGINANTMSSGFTLTNSAVSNTGDGDNEHAIRMMDLSGTVSVQATSFNNTAEDFFNIDSSANTNQMILNVGTTTAVTFTQPNSMAGIRAAGAFAGNGILVAHKAAKNYTINVSNSTFTDVKLFGIQVGSSAGSTATNVNVNLDNNDFLVTILNALGNPNNRANTINIQGLNTLDIDASITNNLLDNGGGGGIQLGADNSSNVHANITGNTVSDQFADAILIGVDENASLTVLIDSNQISNTSSDGMELSNGISPGGVSTLNATITNNVVNGHNNNAGANAFVGGITIFGAVETADQTNIDIRSNNVSGNPSPGVYFDYYTQSFGDTIFVEGPGTGTVMEAQFLTPGTLANVSGSVPAGRTFLGNVTFNNNVNVPLPVLTP